jgi:hypothetical protein
MCGGMPQDTGGVAIVRMSLSANGEELFGTDSMLSYAHCGLQADKDYTYTIEIENAAGLVNRKTSTFLTTAATAPGPVTFLEPVVSMNWVQLPVAAACDSGGAVNSLTLSYRVFLASNTSSFIDGEVSCCSIEVLGLEAATDYQAQVRAASLGLLSDWEIVNFTTLSEMPSTSTSTSSNETTTALSFRASQLTVTENASSLNIEIVRTGDLIGQVSVTVTSSISSSIAENPFSKLVVFEDGIGTVAIPITIRSSAEYELRRFTLTLADPSDGAVVNEGKMVVTVVDQGDMSLPGAPRIVQQTSSGGCIQLGLQPPTFMGGKNVVGFRYNIQISGSIYATASNVINVCDLAENGTYLATAALYNGYGEGESQIINVTSGVLSTPTQVIELLANPVTSGFAQLSWKPPVDKGGVEITRYEITVLNQASNEQRLIDVPGSNLSAPINLLVASTWYTFTVRAVNRGGLVGPDVSITASTGYPVAPTQPPPPELINATGGALHVRVLAPMDCGGSPLTYYYVNIARNTGDSVTFRQYAYDRIQSSSYDRKVADVSIYGLLSSSEYFIVVAVMNAQVSFALLKSCSIKTIGN